MELKYHQPVFDLLGLTPTFDPTAEAKIVAVEEAYGVVLPPSVREWYSLKDSMVILEHHASYLMPIPLEEMTKRVEHWFSRRWSLDETEETLPIYECPIIPFSEDDHGITISAIPIDGSEDPPLLVYAYSHDSNMKEEEKEWYKADRFSDAILEWIWIGLYDQTIGCSANTLETTVTPAQFQLLETEFKEITSIATIRRFEYQDQIVHIWQKHNNVAQWWLYATSCESFKDLLKRVWNTGDLSETLRLNGYNKGCRKVFEDFRPPKLYRNF